MLEPTKDSITLSKRNDSDELVHNQQKLALIFDECNFTAASQDVETNTYLISDSEIAKNIVSDCKEQYGQGQIFKGALSYFNQNFDEKFWQNDDVNYQTGSANFLQLHTPKF